MPRIVIHRRQQRRRAVQRKSQRRAYWVQALLAVLSGLAITAAAIVVLSAGGLYAGYRYFAKDLPAPEQVEQLALSGFQTTKIYDRTGQHLLYEVIDPQGGDRTYVPLAGIPMNVRNATIALEDATFYDNPGGINIEGLVRAFYNNLTGNRIQGGSSITAQLARNVTMTPEERYTVSYSRKIKEAILSVELTNRYPGREGRDKILEWYLNTVYYGNHAYGVEAAARAYFGKSAKDLSLAEAAMMANIPQSPAQNPIDNPEQAKLRQRLVLDVMVKQGYITQAEADAASQAEVGKPQPVGQEVKIEAPHFVMYVLDVLEERYGRNAVYGGGLQVITTLDYDLQNKTQEIIRRTVQAWPASSNAHNAASVIIRPSTGEVLAMVGSVDYNDSSIHGQVNMAVSPRQPGSSIKPFTYAAAFEQGYNPGSMIEDKRVTFPGNPPYSPENFDRSTHGQLTIRAALANSYNIPAVVMLNRIGIDSLIEMAHRLGITGLRDRSRIGLSVTLGGSEVTLLDHTYAFSVIANGGTMAGMPVPPQRREPGYRELDPVSILKVSNSLGRVYDEFLQPTTRQVLNPQIAYQVTSILSDKAARVPAFGPGNVLELSRPAAGKTGTTNDYRDCWTMGFTPQVTVGVWVGNSDYTPMGSWYGAIAAAPIWHEIMETYFKDLPPVDFVEPPGMRWVNIDKGTGALSGGGIREILRSEMVPKGSGKVKMDFAICKASGKLATSDCPADQIEHKSFSVIPTEGGEWVRSTTGSQPPTSHCDIHGPGTP